MGTGTLARHGGRRAGRAVPRPPVGTGSPARHGGGAGRKPVRPAPPS
ncbi:hypothetical protein HMPREF1868_01078 [Olsenella sp. DNF00959]|nr:hypothetical protein HMPREF1868_01078 [Olsenella sp. DNF00959]